MQEESTRKVKPNVIQYCGEGYHWDFKLKRCVPDFVCPPGFIYSPEIEDCIPIGTSGGATRICGQEFAQFNLAGQTLTQVVEYVGTKHNAYQDYIYTSLRADTSILTNGNIQVFLEQKTTVFFTMIGFTEANDPLPGSFDLLDTNFVISGYSANATTILNQVKTIVNGYTDKIICKKLIV